MRAGWRRLPCGAPGPRPAVAARRARVTAEPAPDIIALLAPRPVAAVAAAPCRGDSRHATLRLPWVPTPERTADPGREKEASRAAANEADPPGRNRGVRREACGPRPSVPTGRAGELRAQEERV
jgi:hypothetical protein